MKNISVLFYYIILVSCLSSCQNDITIKEEPKNQKKEIVPANKPEIVVEKGELFTQYFTKEEQEALLKIKAFYEKGISDGFTFDEIGEAYDYNSGILRSDLFNEIPHTVTFPYNGEFALAMFEKEIPKLSFVTKKCGFKDTKTENIINYYCPNLDKDFFAYLEELGKDNELIQVFYEEYLSQKIISNGIKQGMLFRSKDNLDFNNFNHQLFYMLFHVFVNEEQIALKKIQ